MIEETNPQRGAILPSNVGVPDAAAEPASEAVLEDAAAGDYALMLSELNSWGLWQTGLGAVHLVAGGFLNAPWGVLLVIVGLASFRFRSAAMFVVYPTTLVWAAFSNITGGGTGWIGFGALQLYFAYRTVRYFSRFLRAERSAAAEDGPNHAARVFPVAAAVFGVLALTSLVLTLVQAAGLKGQTVTSQIELLIGMAINVAVLGVALGLGSALCDYRPKSVAMFGLVTSALAVAAWAAMTVL